MAYSIQPEDGNYYMSDPETGLDMSQLVTRDGTTGLDMSQPVNRDASPLSGGTAAPEGRYVAEEIPGTGISQGEGSYIPSATQYRNLDTGELLPVGYIGPTNDQIYTLFPSGEYVSMTDPRYQAAVNAHKDSQSWWGDVGPGIMNSLAFYGAGTGLNSLFGVGGLGAAAGSAGAEVGAGASGWTSGFDLTGGGALGGSTGAGVLPGLDQIGSDWASGVPTTGTGVTPGFPGGPIINSPSFDSPGSDWSQGAPTTGGASTPGFDGPGSDWSQGVPTTNGAPSPGFPGGPALPPPTGTPPTGTPPTGTPPTGTPPTGTPPGINLPSLNDLLKAGFNWDQANKISDKYIQAAKDIQFSGNPLNDPQRQQYQTQLSNLQNDPSSFWQTNPVAKAQLNLAKNQFEANSAKMGTGGTQFSNYLQNVTNAASGTFNDQAKMLGTLGGFSMPKQGTEAAAGMVNNGIGAMNAGMVGIGNLFGGGSGSGGTTGGGGGLWDTVRGLFGGGGTTGGGGGGGGTTGGGGIQDFSGHFWDGINDSYAGG